MGWMFFVGVLWLLFHFKMRKTLLVLGLSLYSFVLLVLSFAVGGFATFIFTNDTQSWYLLPSWTTALVDSQWIHSNFWSIFFLPLVFAADVLRWMLHITFMQGNVFMWLMMLIGFVGAIRVWYYGVGAFREAQAYYVPAAQVDRVKTWDYTKGFFGDESMSSEERWKIYNNRP